MTESKTVVAVVDDDLSFLRALERLLRAAGLAPLPYSSGEAFLFDYPRTPMHCVVLDIRLGTTTGYDIARKLAADKTRLPVIFMTAHDEPAAREQAQAFRCVAYLRKPFPGQALLEAINQATAAPLKDDQILLANPVTKDDSNNNQGMADTDAR